MSSNKLIYDECEYKKRLQESTGPLAYQLDIEKYENKKKCRVELGLLGGNNVSHIRGNYVDLEGDLRGLTRPPTQSGQCPESLYHPHNSNKIKLHSRGSNKDSNLDTSMVHQKTCHFVDYSNLRYGHNQLNNIQSNRIHKKRKHKSKYNNQCNECM